MNTAVRWVLPVCAYGFVFVAGFLLSMKYGIMGIHPLDSPIVFDGAWRTLSGQVPVAHFHTPGGFTPIAMQALFFRVFGVNWWAYCLHAAVVNGLFGMVVLSFLRRVGLSLLPATVYGLLCTLYLYPPMGVPYLEQHAFFWIAVSLWLTLLARMDAHPRRWRIWLALVPAACLLAVLSKQSPGFFAAPLCLLVWMGMGKKRAWRDSLAALAAGLIPLGLAAGWVLGWQGWFDPAWRQAFWQDFWVYPSSTGLSRLGNLPSGVYGTAHRFAHFPLQQLNPLLNTHFRYLLYLPFLLVPMEWIIRRWRNAGPLPVYPFPLLVLGAGLVLVTSFFLLTSNNQIENGFAFLFFAIGLGHQFWRQWSEKLLAETSLPPYTAWVPRVLLIFLLGTGLWTGTRFAQDVLASRKVLDMPAEPISHERLESAPRVGSLRYLAPYEAGRLNPALLLTWLAQHPGNFLLMGDQSYLYGLSGRPSVSPFLWMHPGLTLPRPESAEMVAADAQFLLNARQYAVRYVVFESFSRETCLHLQLECFPTLSAWVYAHLLGRHTAGGFEIWELGD